MTGLAAGESVGPETLHGSAVAIASQAVLITGAAGAGKTTLALEMIALGADLVADDRIAVMAEAPSGGGAARLWLSAPPELAGLVEVRGFGLARLSAQPRAMLRLIADLDAAETERLPLRRHRVLSGVSCPVMLCKGKPGLAAALVCLLRAEDWPGPEFLPGNGPGT